MIQISARLVHHLFTSGWFVPTGGTAYIAGTNKAVEIKTSPNVQGLLLTPGIMFSSNSRRFFRIAGTDAANNKWSYTIQECMRNDVGLRFLSGVPATETKIWKITKSKTHFHLRCNGNILLNFNFQHDYETGYQNCQSFWESDFSGIVFDHASEMYNGYMSMRFSESDSGKTDLANLILRFKF